MGKKKTKRLPRQPKPKKDNPFEIRVNKRKYDVLGQKTLKHEKGRPGQSRTRANEIRSKSLLNDYERRKKASYGGVIDKRIGENDANLDPEEKNLKRWAAERKATNTLMELDHEDVLTHSGRPLSEIERFDDKDLELSDDDDDGIISADIVNEHFGSGNIGSEATKKTWKERMEEIMVESKKRKYERKLEKDRAQELTETVDAEWKDIMHLVAGSASSKDGEVSEKKAVDDYDMAVRSLKFDARALAGDKLVDEEEAKQKKIKQKMEERDKRMKLTNGENGSEKIHASVDDLDDNFAFGKDSKELNSDQGDSDDSDEESESEEDEENGLEGNLEFEEKEDEDGNDEGKEEDASMDSENDDGDPLQDLSDLESDNSDEEGAEDISDSTIKSDQIFVSEDFKSLFANIQMANLSAKEFKSKLEAIKSKGKSLLCDAVVVCKECCQKGNIQLLDVLAPFVYTLAEKNPKSAAACFLNHLTEMKSSLLEGKVSNPAEIILFIKFVVAIFPASDARHCVTTPASVLLSYILKTMKLKSLRQIFLALFGCSIALEYTERARRISPEAVNILNAILKLCISKHSYPFTSTKKLDILNLKDSAKLKHLDEKERVDLKFVLFSCYGSVADDKHKGLVILNTIKVLRKFIECYPKNIGGAEAFWEPVLSTCELFEKSKNHSSLKAKVKHLVNEIKLCYPSKLQSLKRDKQAPVMLKMLEPKFENVEEVGRSHKNNKGKSREKIEKEILHARVKKEKKGAIRELRRDAAFLAKKRLLDDITKDKQRKAKVKRIYSQLAQQEGDYNALQKKKKS
ncbi:DgyrCDS1621 [Dimorphilus gyrociliatus]|uniref:DgyrCDS1621 n=1 Tax=Dimorphilus gyrociliatus TaxID=2664684 RepID=A0A7I8V821_9ANNE|nr:DgyrCDS1621 [Dimorphilus gyrociliatus]